MELGSLNPYLKFTPISYLTPPNLHMVLVLGILPINILEAVLKIKFKLPQISGCYPGCLYIWVYKLINNFFRRTLMLCFSRFCHQSQPGVAKCVWNNCVFLFLIMFELLFIHFICLLCLPLPTRLWLKIGLYL